MRAIQTLCDEYQEEGIFNMDETGLFWRQALSNGLASEARLGVKKDKSRITVVCCVNFTGALRAVELPQRFREHQEGTTIGEIRVLEEVERSIRLIISN